MSAAELRARLHEITVDIQRQNLLLEELEESRNAIQTQLDSILTYPILNLPVELVSEIFIHCLPTGNIRPKRSQAPLVLLSICRAWRQIALSTPSLWSTLYLDVRELVVAYWTPNDWTPDLSWDNLIDGWLCRAGGRPLSISFHETRLDFSGAVDFTFIKRYMHQLECLDLRTYCMDFNELPCLGSFPLLRKLTIALQDEDQIADIAFRHFQDSPLLRELYLEGQILPSACILPWQQLTTFSGLDFTFNQSLEALRMAPNLVGCTLSIQSFSNTGSISPEPLIHPHLKYLTLINDLKGYCEAKIQWYLTLPALETLEISPVEDLDWGSFAALLTRSSPPLHKLDTAFQTDFIMDKFIGGEGEFLPLLRQLTLHMPDVGRKKLVASLAQRVKTRLDQDPDICSVRLVWPTDIIVDQNMAHRLTKLVVEDVFMWEPKTKITSNRVPVS